MIYSFMIYSLIAALLCCMRKKHLISLNRQLHLKWSAVFQQNKIQSFIRFTWGYIGIKLAFFLKSAIPNFRRLVSQLKIQTYYKILMGVLYVLALNKHCKVKVYVCNSWEFQIVGYSKINFHVHQEWVLM